MINKRQFNFYIEKYEKYVPGEDATRIDMNWNTSEATLAYNDSAYVDTTCCYSEIMRTGRGKEADEKFKYVCMA